MTKTPTVGRTVTKAVGSLLLPFALWWAGDAAFRAGVVPMGPYVPNPLGMANGSYLLMLFLLPLVAGFVCLLTVPLLASAYLPVMGTLLVLWNFALRFPSF